MNPARSVIHTQAEMGASDFDFLLGRWHVAHRRLARRLSHCDEWISFTGTCAAQHLLGGNGNIDDNTLDFPDGPYRAATLRSFDPATQQWRIWWLDGRMPTQLGDPMVGRFTDGVGTFYADDTWEGTPIRVRFLWTKCDSGTPRWEQAFSVDQGSTWETNWVMDFSPMPG